MNFSEIDQFPLALQQVATLQSLSVGQILFHRNEPSQTIYVVKTGRIQLLHYMPDGQVIHHYAIHPGEFCAEVVLFLENYTCSAIAEEPTEVLAFPKQDFLNALTQNSEFALWLLKEVSYRLHLTKVTVEVRSIRSAPERVLHYLQLIVPPEQNTVVLEKPFKDIAAEIGISSEALSRALTQLEASGAIDRVKRKITLRCSQNSQNSHSQNSHSQNSRYFSEKM